jgi:hypothetical protein
MQNTSVSFRVPDFVGEDGTLYSEIEITIEPDDGDTHDAVQLLKTLERARSTDND